MYRLGEDLRPVFQRPFGPIIQTSDLRERIRKGDVIVCVGDFVSRTLIEIGYQPKLVIVDFKTERHDVDARLRQILEGYGKTVLRVANPAATVTNDLYVAVVQGLRLAGSVRIEVDGEEDLAGLPVFAEAPEGTIVLYGMPGKGMVFVRVDAAMRKQAITLLGKMRVEP